MSRRLTAQGARTLASFHKFPLDVDFHSLSSEQVQGVLDAADHRMYRRPRNANGSRARYFHAYLRRSAGQ